MKGLPKLSIKLAALLLPFPLIVMAAMSLFPKYFFDGEYGWYRQNQDYAETAGEPDRVLILGDSAPKAACRPALLSEDTYNLSLQGATPIEEFYILREYLENHAAPQYVICMNGPWYYVTDPFFWSRQMYFHILDDDVLREIEEQIRQTGDCSPFDVSSLREFQKEVALYQLYAPQKYGTVFLKSLAMDLTGNGRSGEHEANYSYAAENKGPSRYFEKQELSVDLSDVDVNALVGLKVESDTFTPSALIDRYFRALIELCQENDIQFIFQSTPLNADAKDSIDSGWLAGFEDYMDGIQADYPAIRVEAACEWYESLYFYDVWHLDKAGAERYCGELRQKYPYVFLEETQT